MLQSPAYGLARLSAEGWACAVYYYHMALYRYGTWNYKHTTFSVALVSVSLIPGEVVARLLGLRVRIRPETRMSCPLRVLCTTR